MNWQLITVSRDQRTHQGYTDGTGVMILLERCCCCCRRRSSSEPPYHHLAIQLGFVACLTCSYSRFEYALHCSSALPALSLPRHAPLLLLLFFLFKYTSGTETLLNIIVNQPLFAEDVQICHLSSRTRIRQQ